MDQVQTKALEALHPYVHLTASSSASSPRFVANIIANATSNPHTYSFAELLETPAVQSLKSLDTPEEFRVYATLLEIFAWGTWQDYQNTPNLPQLSAEQTLKLRLLSLLTLTTTVRPLTYQSLMSALDIATSTELESLVTTAIYESLIVAKLSPATSPPTLHVRAIAPLRDVQPQEISKMISLLAAWQDRCGSVIGDIEAEIAKIKTQAARHREEEREQASRLERSVVKGWEGEDHYGMTSAGDRHRDGSSSGGGGSSSTTTLRSLRGPTTAKQNQHQQRGTTATRPAASRNKREFSGDDDEDEQGEGNLDDDGYGDSDGGVETAGSRMDIDAGLGANVPAASGSIGSSAVGKGSTRQAKRISNMSKK